MSKLPGSSGISLLSDKSLEFYRDPVAFYERRIKKHGSRIFEARLLNKSTSFVCSVQGMKELLCGTVRLSCWLNIFFCTVFSVVREDC